MYPPDASSRTRFRRRLLQVLFVCHLMMITLASEAEAETEVSPKTSDDSQDADPMKNFVETQSSSGTSDSTGVSIESNVKGPIGFDDFSMPLPEDPDLRFAVCLLHQAYRGQLLSKEIINFSQLENVSLPESCLSSLCSEDVKISAARTDGQPSYVYFSMYSASRGLLDTCWEELRADGMSVLSIDAEGNAAYHINSYYRLVLFSNPSCMYIPEENIVMLMTMYVFSNSPPKCLTSILCSPLTYIETIIRENKPTVWVPKFRGNLPVSQLRLCYDIAKNINDKEREEGKRNQSDTVGTVAYFPMLSTHEIVVMKQPYCQMLPLALIKLVVYGNSPLPESCLNLFCQSPVLYYAERNGYLSFKGNDSGEIDQCLSQLMVSPDVIRQDNLSTFSLSLESNYSMLPPDSKFFFLTPQRRPCLTNFRAHFEVFSLAVQRKTIVSKECLPLLCEPIFYPVITEGFQYFFSYRTADILSSCYSTLSPTPGLSNYTKLLKLTSKHGVLLTKPDCPEQSVAKFSLFALMYENSAFPSHCFAELCYQDIANIDVNNKGLTFYLGVSDTNTNGKCFESIQNSSFSYQHEEDLQNCTILTVKLPVTTDLQSSKWENNLVLRDPSCGYNTQSSILTVGRFMNFLSVKLYASAPEDIRKPYQCLASRLESTYAHETLVGAVDSAERFRAYTVGAELTLPSSCQNLTCEQSIIVSYQSHVIFGEELETYITIFAQDMQSSKTMTECIADLKTMLSNNTEVLENDGPYEVSIPSSVSMSGAPSLGTYSLLFITFPDCVVINEPLRALQISYAYLFLKDFPSSCRTMICDSDTSFHIEKVGGNTFTYTASKKATAYGITCLSQLEEKEESFGIYTVSENLARASTSRSIDHFVFDFDPPEEYSSLYGYLLLKKRLSNIDDSCLRCLIKSNVEQLQDQLIYTMVPFNDSISQCNLCFSTGLPITDDDNFRPDRLDVVALLNSTVTLLLRRSQNRV